jgi:hypothetical protein
MQVQRFHTLNSQSPPLKPIPAYATNKRMANTVDTPRFSGQSHPTGLQEKQIQALAESILQEIGSDPKKTDSAKALVADIKQNRPLTLPEGYRLQYGVIFPDGKIKSPYPEAQSLLQGALHDPALRSGLSGPTPILLKIASPTTEQAFTRTIKNVLRSTNRGLAHTYTSKNGVENHNVILTDLIENLVSGNRQLMSKAVQENVLPALLGTDREDNPLRGKYQAIIPGNQALSQQLNRNQAFQNAREKRMGLDLAQKVYSEGQKVESTSVILSLIIGGLSEPTINHFFHDGGPIASIARTTILSGVDILGNILSVMGMVSDRLESRELKLSLKTVFGKNGIKDILKNPKMEGAAGPDIKQGIKVGMQGGILGVLTNIPAATIMSLNNADLLSRSVIGGIGAASSGVAIPFEVRDSKESLVHSIEELVKQGMIKLPDHLKSEEKKKYIERLAFKEMNSRLGYASSIKAMNPVPLIGTGTAILGSEKLGIPREYAQTAYMGLAPVMHNFLRLVYAGWEKKHVIPRRLNKMEQLVNASPDKPFTEKQRKELDNAFLSGFDSTLDKCLTSTVPLLTTAGAVFGTEFLYFAHTWRKSKQDKVLSATALNAVPAAPHETASTAPQSQNTPPAMGLMPLPPSSAAPLQAPNWVSASPFPLPGSPGPVNLPLSQPWPPGSIGSPYAQNAIYPVYPGYGQALYNPSNYGANRPGPFQVTSYPSYNLTVPGLPQQTQYNRYA